MVQKCIISVSIRENPGYKGREIEDMFCPNCGTQAQDGAKFCSKCGALLSAATPSPSQPNNRSQRGQSLLDREIDNDLADKLKHAQAIIHEADALNWNYAYAQFNYARKQYGFGKVKYFILGFLGICIMVTMSAYSDEKEKLIESGQRVSGDLLRDTIFLLLLFSIPFLLILLYIIKQSNHVAKQERAAREHFDQNMIFLEFLPPEFRTSERIDYIINQFKYGRCRTLREALNMCETAQIGKENRYGVF